MHDLTLLAPRDAMVVLRGVLSGRGSGSTYEYQSCDYTTDRQTWCVANHPDSLECSLPYHLVAISTHTRIHGTLRL